MKLKLYDVVKCVHERGVDSGGAVLGEESPEYSYREIILDRITKACPHCGKIFKVGDEI